MQGVEARGDGQAAEAGTTRPPRLAVANAGQAVGAAGAGTAGAASHRPRAKVQEARGKGAEDRSAHPSADADPGEVGPLVVVLAVLAGTATACTATIQAPEYSGACSIPTRQIRLCQLGHEDPRFTLRVYAWATKRQDRLSPPHAKRSTRLSNGHRRHCRVWKSSFLDPDQTKNPAYAGLLREADEGTRTLDLLHGKQTL